MDGADLLYCEESLPHDKKTLPGEADDLRPLSDNFLSGEENLLSSGKGFHVAKKASRVVVTVVFEIEKSVLAPL